MNDFSPIYTNFDNVKIKLVNKVQFQSDPDLYLDGELPNALLGQLIVDAETEVEQDLRTRYAIPFQSKRTGSYIDLPDHSKRAIRRLVDLKSVMLILGTDFGRGSHVSADAYYSKIKKEYEEFIERVLGRDLEAENGKIDRFRRSPPLEDMKLAPTNKEADDGYRGMIINTDQSVRDPATYAGEQINNPAGSSILRRPAGIFK